MGQGRLELPTLRLSGVRSNHLSYWPGQWTLASPRQYESGAQRGAGGVDRDRTDDLRLAKPALSQLSYDPMGWLTSSPPLARLLARNGASSRSTLQNRVLSIFLCRSFAPFLSERAIDVGLTDCGTTGAESQKGGDPAAGSPTATLLRLHPSYQPLLGTLPPLRVGVGTSGATDSHGVTGGVYKARERIHRGVLIRDY